MTLLIQRSRFALLVRTCILTLVVSAASGCGPKVRGLQQDPSFTYASLAEGQIGVGGVTTLVHQTDDIEAMRTQLSSLLRIQLMEADGGYGVVSAGALRSQLGADVYNADLDAYRLNGRLTIETLEAWQFAILDMCRYVVLARIEDDLIQNEREETSEAKGGTHVEVIKYKTTRTLSIGFIVHDLRDGKAVWSANLHESKTNTIKYEDGQLVESDDKGVWETITDAVVDILDTDSRYPPPPALTEVAEGIFKGFAKELPKQDS